jgi:CheY-like chemotaxis protein
MVYGIVTSHGGAIICDSTPGQGTTFRLYFPVAELALADQEATMPKVEKVGGSETVLVVDDDPVVQRLGCSLLERFGYTVLEAVSGEEALEIYEGRGPSIALTILDLNMPGMGGGSCLARLMEMDPAARVIIASGYAPQGTEAESLAQQARGFLGKPYQLDGMLQMVREVLDQTA